MAYLRKGWSTTFKLYTLVESSRLSRLLIAAWICICMYGNQKNTYNLREKRGLLDLSPNRQREPLCMAIKKRQDEKKMKWTPKVGGRRSFLKTFGRFSVATVWGLRTCRCPNFLGWLARAAGPSSPRAGGRPRVKSFGT